MQTILSAGPNSDNDTARNFDIIGFDPRGVNNTTPWFSCFSNDIERAFWDAQIEASGVLGSSDAAFDVQWAKQRALADSCSKRAVEAGIGEHMSTPNVARDIVEISKRHGQWREKEARRLFSLQSGRLHRRNQVSFEDSAILDRLRYRAGKEMVQYWGFVSSFATRHDGPTDLL